MITLVSGLPRSGTSLVMRMLGAGGHPLCYEQPESFECARFPRIDLDAAEGRAVKWLDPFNFGGPPHGRAYRTIVLTRDAREQARSMARLLAAFGEAARWRVLVPSIRRDTARLAPFWAAFGPVLPLTFEALLAHPHETAGRLASFCGLPFSPAMGDQVLARGPEASPEFAEIALAHDPRLWRETVAP